MEADKVMKNAEFISKVWEKVDELELIELEKKEIERNKKIILKEKIKNICLLSTACIISLLLIRFNIADHQVIVFATSFLLLTWGNIIQNKENQNRVQGKKDIKMEKWGYGYGN